VDTSGTETIIDEASSSFSLPASHVKIKAEFEPLGANIYTVKTGDIPNGKIIPVPASGKEFTPITLWVTPDMGYRYEPGSLKYKLDPANVEFTVPDNERTFKLPGSQVEVFASFIKLPDNARTIQVKPTAHGMIIPARDYGTNNEYIGLTIKPDPGYRLKQGSLQYEDSKRNIKVLTSTNNFNMPPEHIVLYAEFEPVTLTVNVDPAIKNGVITRTPAQGTIGTPVVLTVTPDNGYRLVPNSLKYRITGNNNDRGTAINEKTRQFSVAGESVTITAQFEPYAALRDIKVNNRPIKDLAPGKTAYTVWVPRQEADARFTFVTETGAVASPRSGEAKSLKVFEQTPVIFTVTAPNGIDKTTYTITAIREFIPSVAVPAGSFQRDNNRGSLSKISGFRMGTCEVTQEEWKTVMGFGGGTEGNTYPACNVNWYEAVVFCNKLSMLEGKTPAYTVNNSTDPAAWGNKIPNVGEPHWNVSCKWDVNGYRLPTEMEWQWAAMGADARLPGKINSSGYGLAFAGAGEYPIDKTAWFKDNSAGAIHPAGEKAANELGLYDMSGNVMEWSWDWVNNNYKPNYTLLGTQDNWHGRDNNTGNKMRRGGCYLSEAPALFLNYRGVERGSDTEPQAVKDPRSNDPYVGLRIVNRD
jgi:formylglycine-generating enzyme required for sulfatase activity